MISSVAEKDGFFCHQGDICAKDYYNMVDEKS